jgi:hypothetical protein
LTFFFEATSQLVGSPFIFDVMLRSGVPPHMGQFPVPGSDAETGIEVQDIEVRRQKTEERIIAIGLLLLRLNFLLLTIDF